ncbi:uncharacterized protein FOMMEDRAFT_72012, partial [Fomitiporia mediterranea MF3/22]|uniref:uncharacterized protein n=1 Tax=Fomitiporia mediterranea (strain MF3/22) TaxID=694068 RepID=UPI0004407586
DFLSNLFTHLLSWILSRNKDNTFILDEINSLHIQNNRLYKHRVIHVNYTTYNVRRVQDSLNPCLYADIMVYLDDQYFNYLFIFVQIVSIFHVNVAYFRPRLSSLHYKRIDFV